NPRLEGEGPSQGTGVREAQPATARRHCELAEADERHEEAGVRRAGGQPWLALAWGTSTRSAPASSPRASSSEGWCRSGGRVPAAPDLCPTCARARSYPRLPS